MLTRRTAVVAATTLVTLGSVAGLPLVAQATQGPGFSHVAVDPNLAGGEPLSAVAPISGGGSDLVYTSHEGTTHLFRDGISDPSTACATGGGTLPSGFLCSYTNQVNVWTSSDNGQTWVRSTVGPSGAGPTSPFGLGFSDPDLTTDESGILYNTGIDLANDAVFASIDGGRTWNIGNNNCHSGDRPWLAGGVANQVFLATDTVADAPSNPSQLNAGFNFGNSGHEVFMGTVVQSNGVGVINCVGMGDGQADPTAGVASQGVPDYGTSSQSSSVTYTAAGKLFYDHNHLGDGYTGALIDPAVFSDGGVGISVLKDAAAAFASGGSGSFVQHEIPGYTKGVFAHWPSIGLDSQDNVYLTWDTATTGASSNLVNAIDLAVYNLQTQAWTGPITITQPGTSVLWPWVTVGSPGNAAVVWYQYAAPTSPDSGTGNVSLFESTVFGALTSTPTVGPPIDAVGAPIHNGGICQGGTFCVATGQDRRLGDFFTDSIDSNGCLLISTGQTTTDPSAATSRPLFIKQTNGTSLTGADCASPSNALPEAPLSVLIIAGGGGAVAAILARRRRRPALTG
ncbi:MAG: hypothetical protein ACYDAC_09650 [Candidatus Dormibacteria bacterium]